LVDFVRSWSEKSDIPVSHFLPWIGIGTSKFHDWIARLGKVNEHNAWVPRDHWLTLDEKERIRTFARAHPLEGYRRLTFMMLDAGQVACSPAPVPTGRFVTCPKFGVIAYWRTKAATN
jgi:hypothetical protein